MHMIKCFEVNKTTRKIPFYTCLDETADPVRSTLDHPRIAHRLYSIITSTTIIQRKSYNVNKSIIRTVHQL